MAKKTVAKKKAPALIDLYLDHLLETGAPPPSVFKFCRQAGIREAEFYSHFASFDALEGKVWKGLIDDTTEVLKADPEYATYPARQKLAAFYFTFLETAMDRRSFLLLRFPGVQLVNPPAALRPLQQSFEAFAEPMLQEAKEKGEVACRGNLNRVYPGLLYAQLLFVLDFWLKDESNGFERSDALVEKSVALAFDLLGTQAFDSALDFLRFMAGAHRAA